MKFSTDNDSLLFYPERDMDLFAFGKAVGCHGINFSMHCHVDTDKIEYFEINGKDIWSFLLLPEQGRG